ncbi:hypothetical protein ABIB38_004665 [Massilia sp. UYP11]
MKWAEGCASAHMTKIFTTAKEFQKWPEASLTESERLPHE